MTKSMRAKGGNNGTAKRKRKVKPYPITPFNDVLALGKSVLDHGGGKPTKRLTLMEKMNRSPTSGTTRSLITDSSKYNITTGSHTSDTITLTDLGAIVCDESRGQREITRAEFQLAIEKIEPFKALYDKYVNSRLPSREVLKDTLEEECPSVDPDDYMECVDIFVVNANHVGLLKTIAGQETLVSLDTVLDELPASSGTKPRFIASGSSTTKTTDLDGTVDWDKTCFYVSPIGEEGSEARNHSDLFLSSLVAPALREVGLDVHRADAIEHSGMITRVVLEHIAKCRLVVADLSFLNPNVFYEMSLRHACRKPIIHIIRKADRIPFDVNQVSTVVVDTTDIYSLVPHLDSLRSQIAARARTAIGDPGHTDNPITAFYPEFWEVQS